VDTAREFRPLSLLGGYIKLVANSNLSLRKFDLIKIEEGLKCLRLDNFRITIIS
jgi:hypothetical protein